jgi:hypothetical protein
MGTHIEAAWAQAGNGPHRPAPRRRAGITVTLALYRQMAP